MDSDDERKVQSRKPTTTPSLYTAIPLLLPRRVSREWRAIVSWSRDKGNPNERKCVDSGDEWKVIGREALRKRQTYIQIATFLSPLRVVQTCRALVASSVSVEASNGLPVKASLCIPAVKGKRQDLMHCEETTKLDAVMVCS